PYSPTPPSCGDEGKVRQSIDRLGPKSTAGSLAIEIDGGEENLPHGDDAAAESNHALKCSGFPYCGLTPRLQR
ncbi:hypothetical protein, partial [Mesorhizobium sp.]|uniref:hypothetical protein n=1 Tax=Mesorhizobium sp. TaxID=1871066 RepID=UPI0025C2AC75